MKSKEDPMVKSIPIVSRILVAVLFFLLVPLSPSVAADAGPQNYFGLKLGAYYPQHDHMKDFNEGFSGEIFYGLLFQQYFASELGVGYFKASGHIPSLDFSLKVVDIIYTIKGVLSVGVLELYAGPGAGVYFAKINVSSTLPGVVGGDSDMSTSFGYHVLFGGNININPALFLGVEGKYIWAKTNESIIPSSGPFGSHLDGFTATANVGYRF
jgi:opacity protein-like surface antigen